MRLLIITAGLLAMASGLLADDETQPPRRPQPPQGRPDLGRLFEAGDKNKDGFLDKDEVPERMKERFDQLDENKDGKLSREELQKVTDRLVRRPGGQPGFAPAGAPDPLFRALDSDSDGRLSRDELLAAVKLLEKLDRNQDGYVGRFELGGLEGSPPRPGTAAAPDAARRIAEMFDRLDTNKDGKIAKDETQGPLAGRFDRLDANKDGVLDKGELSRTGGRFAVPGGAPPEADIGRRLNQLFQRLDANNDGKIGKDEAQGPLADNFDRVDQNKDGTLDKDEARRVLQRLMPPGGTPPTDRPRPAGGAQRPAASFDDLDKNVDGRLTKDEVKGSPVADKFDEIDANKDGKIDPKELEAFRSKGG